MSATHRPLVAVSIQIPPAEDYPKSLGGFLSKLGEFTGRKMTPELVATLEAYANAWGRDLVATGHHEGPVPTIVAIVDRGAVHLVVSCGGLHFEGVAEWYRRGWIHGFPEESRPPRPEAKGKPEDELRLRLQMEALLAGPKGEGEA